MAPVASTWLLFIVDLQRELLLGFLAGAQDLFIANRQRVGFSSISKSRHFMRIAMACCWASKRMIFHFIQT